MSDIVVGASIQVDAGNTAPTIKEVRENIKQYKQELDNAKAGSEEHRQALEKLKKANEQLNPTFKDQGSALSQVKNQLTSSVPAFGQAAKGAEGFGTTLKALMANPIVLLIAAIVAGLKFLYEAFTHTFEGAQKVEQVFAGLSAAVQTVVDRVFALGGAIIKFFSGDFKGAISDAKKAVSGVGDAVADAYNQVSRLTKQAQDLHKEQLQNDLDGAERAKKLAILREQINDDSIPLAKRKAAAQELKKEAEQNAKDDLDLARRTAENKIALLSRTAEEAKKNQDEINRIRIEEINGATENANELRAIGKQVANLEKQEQQEKAQRQKEAADKEKEAKAKAREEEQRKETEHKAFLDKLENLHNENILASIHDATAKKLKEQEIAFTKEKQAIDADLRAKRLTQAQHNELMAELNRSYNNKINAINEEHRKEEAEKQKQENEKIAAQKEADDQKRRELELRESKLRADQNKKNLTIQKQELDGQMALKQWFYMQDLAAAGDNALKKREIELKHNEEMAQLSEQRKAISKAEAEAKAADLDTLGNALNSISDLIGKQTVVGKGLAIATSLINTYQGATKALAQGGMFGFIGAAGVIAAGIASVKKIISTQIPGQASGGGSAGATASTSAPLQPKPQVGTTQLDQQSINGIGNAASGRTFVLDRDIQNNRERAERLNRAARIG